MMRALIRAVADASGVDPDGPQKVSHRVIADHLRATSFLIADGVLPSNEGRGYVLRRIMRRAMRHAELLGAREPLMWRLVPALVREMGQAYGELHRAEALITETLKLEESRFRKTLERGLSILDEETRALKQGDRLKGETAFTLYDTYGFPLDLTQDALRPRGIGVDHRRVQCRDGAAESQGARLVGRLGRGRDRSDLVSAAREARRDRISRLRHRKRRRRRHRAGARRPGNRRAQGRRERPGRAQPDAVLRRVRRPGRRYRDDDGATASARPSPTRRSGRATCSCMRHGRAGRAEGRHRARARRRSRAPLRRSAPIIRRRICCTRRCARCSAITSRRRVRWSRPIACASTSRIPSR